MSRFSNQKLNNDNGFTTLKQPSGKGGNDT